MITDHRAYWNERPIDREGQSREAAWQRVAPYVPSPAPAMTRDELSTALDYGCGGGWFTRKLVEVGYIVTGADFAPRRREEALRNLADLVISPLQEVTLCSPEALAGRRFDLIFVHYVLLHVPDRDFVRVCDLLKKSAKPDAHWVIVDNVTASHRKTTPTSGTGHVTFRTEGRLLDAFPGLTIVNHQRHDETKEVSAVLAGRLR